MKRARLAVAVVGLACLISPIQKSFAQPNMVGRWNGFAENNALPAVQRGASLLDISTQAAGRFKGSLAVPIGANSDTLACDGSVQSGGGIRGVGHDVNGNSIRFRGRMVAFTSQYPPDPCSLIALRYRVFSPAGVLMDHGYVLLIQMHGGANWATPRLEPGNVTGQWAGGFQPGAGPGGGSVTMDLAQQRNNPGSLITSFSGGIDMANIFLPAVQRFFNLSMIAEGTVSIPQPQPDSPAQFGAIGITPQPQPGIPGVVSIFIGVLLPAVQNQVPAVQGNVRLYSSFADAYTEIVTGVSTAFSAGSFSTQFVPGG